MIMQSIFCLLTIWIIGVYCYPTGPPKDACADAVPQHPPYKSDPYECPYLVEFDSFVPGNSHTCKYQH